MKLLGICPECKHSDKTENFDWESGHTWYCCPKCNAKFDEFANEDEILTEWLQDSLNNIQSKSL